MVNLLLSSIFFVFVAAGVAFADEKGDVPGSTEISQEDMNIIKVMDILKMMDLMENLDMMKDWDVLVEDDKNEKED